MNNRFPLVAGAFALAFLVLLAVLGNLRWDFLSFKTSRPGLKPADTVANSGSQNENEEKEADNGSPSANPWLKSLFGKLAALALELGKDARTNEAVLKFKSDAEFYRFLELAKNSGLNVKDRMAKFNAVRVGFDSLDALKDFFAANPDLDPEIAANPLVHIPQEPTAKEIAEGVNVSVGGSALPLLGIDDNTGLGAGFKIAILDSAIANLGIFNGRIQYLKVVDNPTTDLSHGTSVADLAAGPNGVSPGASILSVAVVAADGMSDAFTLAQGIIAAVDAGASVVNISLGSYSDSGVLQEAVRYATEKGSVIVASAGNDGLTDATYPARIPGVIAATASDANGQTTFFSNESTNTGFIAPGYGVLATGADGKSYLVNGTSFSAPLIAGSIAATMGIYPGTTTTQAVDYIRTTADEAGALGPDSAYGYGQVDMDGVVQINTAGIVDGRVASNSFNAKGTAGPEMNYVVQNNGTASMGGWTLQTNTNGVQQTHEIPNLAPNQSYQVPVPVTQTGDVMQFESRLVPPQGVQDVNGRDNGRSSTVVPAK